MLGYHPPGTRQTPPGRRHPPEPGRPPWEQSPPRTRQTPREQTPPQEQTPPRSRHPPGSGRPPRDQTPPGSRLPHTVYERPVRILLECILVLSELACTSNEINLNERCGFYLSYQQVQIQQGAPQDFLWFHRGLKNCFLKKNWRRF